MIRESQAKQADVQMQDYKNGTNMLISPCQLSVSPPCFAAGRLPSASPSLAPWGEVDQQICDTLK
jgi:hypothetical protein